MYVRVILQTKYSVVFLYLFNQKKYGKKNYKKKLTVTNRKKTNTEQKIVKSKKYYTKLL